MWTQGAFYLLLGFSLIRVAILSIDDRKVDIGRLHNKISDVCEFMWTTPNPFHIGK